MTKVIFRDIPGGKPGIFCWGEIGGKPGILAGENWAEGQGFVLGVLFGPHFSSWGKLCRMMIFMCCHHGYDAVIVRLYVLIMRCLCANNWFLCTGYG